MKKITTLAALLLCFLASAKDYSVSSPKGRIEVTVSAGQSLTWTVSAGGSQVILPSEISITTDKGTFGPGIKVKKAVVSKTDATRTTPVYKKASVRDNYTSLVLKCQGDFDLEVRAYDEFAAYRLINKKDATVMDESVEMVFAGDYKAFLPYFNDNRMGEKYSYSFESYYDEQKLSQMFADSIAVTPLAVCLPQGRKAVVMDAGVVDYPGLYFKKGEGSRLVSEFAGVPLTIRENNHTDFLGHCVVPDERASYIAQIKAGVNLPWRAVVVTDNDAELLSCDIAQLLGPEQRIQDTDWIKPGKVAWDWWNATILTGVDFRSGMNTPTYKYYIDFASKYGLEYIIIDEGWSGKGGLYDLNPEIDLKALIPYADARNVGIILWSSWKNIKDDTEAIMDHYAKMGIKGFKIDFIDRDDQIAVASAYGIADIAAKHHLLVDYHGFKPQGVQVAYPNVINFEGVKGLENSKWEGRTGAGPVHDQPRYDVIIPYLRNLAGPMDYTPGAMVNATKSNFFGNNDHPMSQGTRVHQMAMYTIFDAPLQMLADSPSKYLANPECTEFMSAVPTTFDETVALGGEIGEFVALARRKGDTWYIAAMTNWNERDIVLDLTKLQGLGKKAVVFEDGVNAYHEPTDFKRTETSLSGKINVHLAPGGGWTAIVR